MIKIMHISDLHFGTETKNMMDLLHIEIEQQEADVIIITGDFTQRARTKQFQQAKEFLESLDSKKILCVPGNHDITWYNLFERYFYPFNKYQKYISTIGNPTYSKDNVFILGINSATPYRAMNGHIRHDDLNQIGYYFHNAKPDSVKIVALHHNLIRSDQHNIISNANVFMDMCALHKVDLILSGHLHYACMETITRHSHRLYAITAGTAVSQRLRRGQNSYNSIEIEPRQFKLTIREYNNKEFFTKSEKEFDFSR